MLLDGRAIYPSYAAKSIGSPWLYLRPPELNFIIGSYKSSLIKRHLPTLAEPVERFIRQYLIPLHINPSLYNSVLSSAFVFIVFGSPFLWN